MCWHPVRILTILGIVATLVPTELAADTLSFKNGRAITGKVVKRDSDSVMIEVDGYKLTYVLEAIERIGMDGPPRTRPSAAPSSRPPIRPPPPAAPAPTRRQEARIELSPSQVFQAVASAVAVVTAQRAMGGGNQGSGFLIDPDGVVVTNFHVVAGAEAIEVKLKNGRTFAVTGVVAFDPEQDICVLKIDASDLPAVSLGDSRQLAPGAKVLVIGAPLGLDYTITNGLFSGSRTSFGQAALQFSAPISPGNSGGPLLDAQGRVVGITTFMLGGQNLNFAIPIEAVQALIRRQSASTLVSVEQFAASISKA